MKLLIATVAISAAMTSACRADERNTTVAAALHKNSIEDAQTLCTDYLIADEAKEASVLAGATAMVRTAKDPRKLMDRMNVRGVKLQKALGQKEYCALIARRLSTIYRRR
jgi:hypothetical protein